MEGSRAAKRARSSAATAATRQPPPGPEKRAVAACIKASLADSTLDATTWAALKHTAQHCSIEVVEARESQFANLTPLLPEKAVWDSLWPWLWHKTASARLAALLVADGLFDRSAAWRRSVCLHLTALGGALLGLDPERPLPDARGVGAVLRAQATRALHRWHTRWVDEAQVPVDTHDFRAQLHLYYCFARDKRGVQFVRPPSVSPDREAARARTRVANAQRELDEGAPAVELTLSQVENALALLLPSFEDRYSDAHLLHVDDEMHEDEAPAVADDEWEVSEEQQHQGEPRDVGAAAQVPGLVEVAVTVKTAEAVAATADNALLLQVCREGAYELRGAHARMLRYCLDVLAPGSDARARAEALMERLQSADAKCKVLGIR